MNSVHDLVWARPHFYWASLIIFAAIILFTYRQLHIRRVIDALGGNWQPLLIQNFSPFKQYIKILLFFFGQLFLFIALLRPQWNTYEEVIQQEGRDVLIALDISKSMRAKDCQPNRLAYAKKKIRSLLRELESERVGLLLFSGSAFVQCPLTTDYSAFHMFLDHVDVETISSGTTALDTAVQEAIKLFTNTETPKNKLLLLCTDGEDFSSNLASVKQQAHKEGVRIFTMGFGTPEGAPVPLYDLQGQPEGHQKDQHGKVVISKRNDGILQSLAHDLGGLYVPASSGNRDIKQIKSKVEQIEKSAFEDKKIQHRYDQYHWFIAAGLLCLLIEWIL